MKKAIANGAIEIAQGDLTREVVDAIVNAANTTLLGGGGVDGAIHRAGGPAILAECEKLGGCPTGDAKITTGGRLPAKHVIHAVGPVYRDGTSGEANAAEKGLQSVSFPAISCGVYGYPLDEAARIALGAAADHLAGETSVTLVRFVLFSGDVYGAFERALAGVCN